MGVRVQYKAIFAPTESPNRWHMREMVCYSPDWNCAWRENPQHQPQRDTSELLLSNPKIKKAAKKILKDPKAESNG